MKPFAEWMHNEDAIDLDLARRLVAERWPDTEAKVVALDAGYEIGVRLSRGRVLRLRLPEMNEKPPLFRSSWRPPADWSEPAIQRALSEAA